MKGSKKKHLRRLQRIFSDDPIYFITTCTHQRASYLANGAVHRILMDEWQGAQQRHSWHVGNYVIMPDHVHFFCRPCLGTHKPLSQFIGAWKEWTSKRLRSERAIIEAEWQAEFFDHVMRSDESYTEKIEYVRNNPVRAGLAEHPEDWPYQGTVEDLVH